MSEIPAEREKAGRIESFGWVTFAYVVALAVALWLVAGERGAHAFRTLYVADVVATVIIFAFSIRWNNGSVYDPYWSVVPPFIALYWIAQAVHASTLRQVVVTVLVFLWGIRLTYNWARGWPGLHHEDWRYVDLYKTAPMPKWAISFLGIHFFPTVMVLLGCLALIPALAHGGDSFGLLDAVALVITAGAILIELVADEQLRSFGRTKQPGDIIANGLWAYSRHPNYFGEITFWWGLFLFGFSANSNYWWTIIGPLAMTAMFQWASIPMLDRRSVERRPGYAEHMRRVNAVVPWPW
jgi:steroid 5-alpha reductase family enzyme